MKTKSSQGYFTFLVWGFSFFSLFLSYKDAQAQGIAINVDPYNSSAEVPGMDLLRGANAPIPPLPKPDNAPPGVDVYYIRENNTPKPAAVGGNPVSSHQSLPPVPPLKEPYILPQPLTEQTSGSVSPFDITPADITPPSQRVSSPSSIAIQIIPPPLETPPAPTSPNPTSETPRRRSLKEILVFSEPPDMETIARNYQITTSDKKNNKSAPASKPETTATYRVLVRAISGQEEKTLKNLYPEAFRTNHQGQTFWQIGRFSSYPNAQQAAKAVARAGLKFLIVP